MRRPVSYPGAVTVLDLVLLVVLVALAVAGFRRGLVVGLLSLAGLVAGAVIGGRVLPELLDARSGEYLPFVIAGGAVVGAVLARWAGMLLGSTIRGAILHGPLRTIDNIGGAALGLAIGLVVCWVVGAVLLYFPGQNELRLHAQESTILSALYQELPPARVMDALERVDPLAVVAGPAAQVGAPDPTLLHDPEVRAAAKSVVRVSGYACGLGVEGSGWIVGPGLVVTNAHVVAGVDRPTVDRRGRRSHAAMVVAFDASNDLAVLRVPGLGGRPLLLRDPVRGASAVVLGYPENGPLEAVAARLGTTVKAIGRDAYGAFPRSRTVTPIRAQLRAGNSGGPAVDEDGSVRAVVFARRPGRDGGYGVPVARVRDLIDDLSPTSVETTCVGR